MLQLELHSIFSASESRGQCDHRPARSLAMFAWNAEGFSEHEKAVISFPLEPLVTFTEAQSIVANEQRPLFLPGEVA